MRLDYDPKVDVLNITFRTGKVKKTIELAPEMNLDIDAKGRPLYLEIIGAKEKLGKKHLTEVQLNHLQAVPAQ